MESEKIVLGTFKNIISLSIDALYDDSKQQIKVMKDPKTTSRKFARCKTAIARNVRNMVMVKSVAHRFVAEKFLGEQGDDLRKIPADYKDYLSVLQSRITTVEARLVDALALRE